MTIPADNETSLQQTPELRRALDAFLVDNPELETLNARLSRFNVFQVLRIERAEIRHSNVLAWLLTPNESHGLGDRFLRRFLSRLLLENQDVDVSLSPAQVELMRLDDVEVLREWHHIDIFARSRAEGWCLLIENKIGSSESPGQLLRYKEVAQAEMPKGDVIPVLLTLKGDEPSEEGKSVGYISLPHGQVLELAERLVDQNRRSLAEDVQTFLDQYLEVLRRLTLQDEELVRLCKTIYRRHRQAIDLIVEYGSSSQVLDGCEVAVSNLPDIESWHRKGDRIWFLPKAMAQHQKDVTTRWEFPPLMWWFHYRQYNARLQLTMELGPLEDPDARIRLLQAIQEAGFKFAQSAWRRESKYTRIQTELKNLRATEEGEPDDDEEYIAGLAQALWERTWLKGKASRIVEVLKSFQWE